MRTGASMSSLWRTPGSVKLVGAKAGLFDMKGSVLHLNFALVAILLSLALNWCEQCYASVQCGLWLPCVVNCNRIAWLDQFAWTISVMQPQVELNYVNTLWTFNITNCFFFPLDKSGTPSDPYYILLV
jgi:hypothetical protein